MDEKYRKLGEMSGLAGLKFTLQLLEQQTAMLFREVPDALKQQGVEALLVDQITVAGGTIAEFCNLPFITVCNALLVNREAGVPPFLTSWGSSTALWARLRNQLGNSFVDLILQKSKKVVASQRYQWKLHQYSSNEDFYSPLAQICQLPAEFDFKRIKLSKCFHYTGPLQEPSGLEPISYSEISFPFEKLNGKPLIYASLGTLQNRKLEIFQKIAEACCSLDVQLVISLGNPNSQESGSNLPGSPIVVSYAPHQQLIERSSLIITHAGMNTTLGALSSGVPLVAIPITNEQPGIAARIARTGAGEMISLSQLSVSKLRATINRVLTEDSYKKNALRLQQEIRQAGGVSLAAEACRTSNIYTETSVSSCQRINMFGIVGKKIQLSLECL